MQWSHLRVRVNERLLVNTPDAFQIASTERVLRARMSGFDFATVFIITGFTFQRCDPGIRQFYAVTGHFFFQCFQAFFDVLKVMT